MGLRCLIGHDYGEPQTSRDRTQRGNEVVVTVSEYRECSRCGHRRILSENKEVTAESAGAAADTDRSPDIDDAEARPAEPSEPTGFEGSADAPDEPMTAAEDDGVILEDDDEPAEREAGAWPEAELGDESDEPAPEHEPWPNAAPQPEPQEPEEPEPPGPDEDPFDAGPEPTTDSATPAAPETAADASSGSSADQSQADHPRPDNRDTEFVCPDCGESWPTRNASLRPGDICPECRRGYLDERVVQ